MESLLSRDDLLCWLRLTLVPGVSLGQQLALLRAFHDAPAVFRAIDAQIVAAAGAEDAARLLRAGPKGELLERTLQWLAGGPGRRLLHLRDDAYPQALLNIHDPPPVLYAQGRLELLNAQGFAIVGSRNATPQGARDAQALAAALSEAGLTIVSGLALGIDAAAHRGGLCGAGSSIAVMGTGADRFYPTRNHGLAVELAQRGCVLTEFPLGTPPESGNFPRRNRLISGLARGVLVVEAALQSGSLSTAGFALQQNRDVFAVPGSIHAPHSKGCHSLIKEGAKLVDEANDVLLELGLRAATPREGAPAAGAQRDCLLDAMGYAPVSLDEIAERTGLDAAKLAARLSRLEIEGRISALAGGRFQRCASRVIE